jgi:NADH-ubiquinone oxidoreductase chain 3
MTSTTFFIIFIPILAVLLLAINLILAPHNPYQEKDSVFECGFHSFLGQNRTQFSVSFFIFALLFLLFDLEILLVYPYSVSTYTNDIYGLAVMMIFFVLLTLGFVFELGKNALTIDTRQTSSYGKVDTSVSHAFLTSKYENIIQSAPDVQNLTDLILTIGVHLAEISSYINKFNNIISETGINVITDSQGNMEMDAPSNMSDELAKKVSLRISIIDSLINKRQSDVSELIDKGLALQKNINSVDPLYKSEILSKVSEFEKLKGLYKH